MAIVQTKKGNHSHIRSPESGKRRNTEDDISIKATTNEKMGFIGREEGVVAYAVCLIEKVES